MTNITLSIDDEVYKKMRKYSEVKWSEFVRKCVHKRVQELDSLEKNNIDPDKSKFLADVELLAEDWLSDEDELAWKDL